MPQTVTFKLLDSYRYDIANGSTDLPALQALLTEIGANGLKRRFPTASRPNREKNEAGQKLADLTLIYECHFSSDYSVEEVVNRLYHLGIVQYAEPHYIDKLFYTANDPSISQQWHINKISAPDAWDTEQGSSDIVIAIVDSGTDETHEDLAPNYHFNANDPVNGTDDDNDGYIDNNLGWDFVDNDNSPQYVGSNHGVHVAGCASPATDNGIGVAGAGFNCALMPIRVGDATIPFGYEGITYAADMGADIINCSWGGENFSNAGLDVVTYATINHSCLVVAAAGNDAVELAHYPSSFDYVLSVASTDITDNKSSFSTYHSTVDVSAPGSNIFATFPGDNYGFNSGTSMASPVAAGAAALIKSKYPFLSGLQVGEQLRVTADDIYSVGGNSAYTGMLGSGRINLATAVGQITQPSVQLTNRLDTDGNDDAYVVGDTVYITNTFTNYLLPTGDCDALLSTTSPFVNVTDGTSNIGTINTNQSEDNAADPFKIVILPGTPLNQQVEFEVELTDGSYTNIYYFTLTLNVDYVNIRVNEVHTSITSKGIIGFNDFSTQLEGLGFRYIPGGGENLLFDGGLMIGAVKNGVTLVSDHVRGDGTDVDADFGSVVNVSEGAPVVSDIDVSGVFSDAVAALPLDITVKHKAYAWNKPGHTKYVAVEYTIVNDGSAVLNDLYAGIFCDWDIQEFDDNKAATDNDRQLGYCYNTNVDGYYAGVQLLSDGPFIHYAVDHVAGGSGGADLSDGYTTAEKYTTMSNIRETAGSGTGNDVFNVVSTGPYTLNAGDSVTVAFALVGGESLADIQASSDSAFVEVVGGAPNTGINRVQAQQLQFALQPNPASSNALLQLPATAADGAVQVRVTDLAGKTVWTQQLNGANRVELPAADWAPGVYMVLVQNGGQLGMQKLVISH